MDPEFNNNQINQNPSEDNNKTQNSSTELITKNTSLRNLYLIGFNTKPANKTVVNSINFEDAIEKIKKIIYSKAKRDEINMRSYGNLILGLSKFLSKNLKIYNEELDNLLRANKEKANIKAKTDKEKLRNLLEGKTEKEKKFNTKFLIDKKSEEIKENLDFNYTAANLNVSKYIEKGLILKGKIAEEGNLVDKYSTIINESTRDFTLNSLAGKTNLGNLTNLTNLSEGKFPNKTLKNINQEFSNFFNKFDINKIEEENPSMIGLSSKKSFFTDEKEKSRMDMMRNSNMNLISGGSANKTNLYNLNSNSINLSGNKFLNSLIDKSNFEDEIFKRELNFNYMENLDAENLRKFEELNHEKIFTGKNNLDYENENENIENIGMPYDNENYKENENIENLEYKGEKRESLLINNLNEKLEKEMCNKFFEGKIKGKLNKKNIIGGKLLSRANRRINNFMDLEIYDKKNFDYVFMNNKRKKMRKNLREINEKFQEKNLEIMDQVKFLFYKEFYLLFIEIFINLNFSIRFFHLNFLLIKISSINFI